MYIFFSNFYPNVLAKRSHFWKKKSYALFDEFEWCALEREFEECEEFENWNDRDTCGFFSALSEVKVKIFFS